MKVYEIAQMIENAAPAALAYDWDNVGLLVGNGEKETKRVFLTLDTNLSTVQEAVEAGADMIISHHPIFFDPVKRIDYNTPIGALVKTLVENDIALYAAHTNMDTAEDGINAKLAEIFQLSDVGIIEENGKNTGLGRYGRAKREVNFSSFIEITKMLLKTPVRYAGDEERIIKTVAVASGSCSELIPEAKNLGCDVIVTADIKYHEMIDAYESGICVIDAGHYPTEICVVEIFEDILKNTGLEIVRSRNRDIFKFSI